MRMSLLRTTRTTRGLLDNLNLNRARTLFFLLCILNNHHVALAEEDEQGDDWTDSEWIGLVKYLFAALFVTLGLHLLLYSHSETHSLMKEYFHRGSSVSGDVLSCEEQNPKKFEITVLYKAPVHKFASTRGQFRYPERVEEKRFMRRLHMEYPLSRGTVVEVLWLPERGPQSGMLREVVEHKIANHSHCRTVLTIVPGLLLWILIIWLTVLTIQSMDEDSQKTAYLVVGLSLAVFILGSRMFCDARFQSERGKRFESAVPMVTKSGGGKSEALLLRNNHMPLPVVQGMDVV
jgi:hypothetical protein